MTKFDDVIARAVAEKAHDAHGRHAIYDRARSALANRLRSAVPAYPERTIEAELRDLEDAINRVERGFRRIEPELQEVPPASVTLDRQRHHLRAAVLSCVIFSALVAGLAGYAYRDEIGRVIVQKLRPSATLSSDRLASQTDDSSGGPIPFIFMKQLVPYRSTNAPGTVVIDKAQRYLYVVQANVSAVRYGIALGNDCAEAAGRYVISRKLDATTSAQSPQSAAVEPAGVRALYLDSDVRRIHEADASRSIGRIVRVGCFQIVHPDFAELYRRVPVGTRVLVN